MTPRTYEILNFGINDMLIQEINYFKAPSEPPQKMRRIGFIVAKSQPNKNLSHIIWTYSDIESERFFLNEREGQIWDITLNKLVSYGSIQLVKAKNESK